MTPEQILKEISKPSCASGEHREDYDWVLSPEKLAVFLAQLNERTWLTKERVDSLLASSNRS